GTNSCLAGAHRHLNAGAASGKPALRRSLAGAIRAWDRCARSPREQDLRETPQRSPTGTRRPMISTGAESRTSFPNRSFVLLWLGQVVSQLGNRAFTAGVTYWTMEAKQSATALGVVMATGTLPSVVLGPFAGALADRFPRLTIVIATDMLRGLI